MQTVAVDSTTAGIVAGLILANIGAIVAGWVKLRVDMAKVEILLQRAIQDIDGIAEVVGTQRALARKQKPNP